MSTLSGLLIGFLAIPCSLGMACAGMVVARRLEPTRKLSVITFLLGAAGILSVGAFGVGYYFSRDTSWFPVAMWSYSLLFTAMGLSFGTSDRKRDDQRKQAATMTLNAWRMQYELDRTGSAGPAVLASDLVKIGDIYGKDLGKDDEAIVAYERAFAIYSKEMPSHPVQLEFLRSFYIALERAGKKSRANEVGEYWKAVGAQWRKLRGDEE